MDEIKIIFPVLTGTLSCDGCCCMIILDDDHGWAGGTKLIIQETSTT